MVKSMTVFGRAYYRPATAREFFIFFGRSFDLLSTVKCWEFQKKNMTKCFYNNWPSLSLNYVNHESAQVCISLEFSLGCLVDDWSLEHGQVVCHLRSIGGHKYDSLRPDATLETNWAVRLWQDARGSGINPHAWACVCVCVRTFPLCCSMVDNLPERLSKVF